MSQVNEMHEKPADELANESLFDEGFSLGEDQADAATTNEGQEAQDAPTQPTIPDSADTPAANPPSASPFQGPSYAPPPASEPEPEPQEPPASTVKTVPVPDALANELAELRKLNPQAAQLALEDSPEGASIRARLEQYGAELAQDRAERVLWQREQDQQRRQTEIAQTQRAVEAHNAAFAATLNRDHPGYWAMLTDSARRAEAVQYQQNVFEWIASKPYAEAAPLMEIAKSGRDPAQVSALLTQYERERGGKPRQPDPTGALAVPGRGAPTAPVGVGDKDSFDAGWNLNPSK